MLRPNRGEARVVVSGAATSAGGDRRCGGWGKAGNSPPNLLEGAVGKGGEVRWAASSTSSRGSRHLGQGQVGAK